MTSFRPIYLESDPADKEAQGLRGISLANGLYPIPQNLHDLGTFSRRAVIIARVHLSGINPGEG